MADDAFIRQAAAIPVRDGRLCLVTSRSAKRWIIPKGLIEPGQTAAEAALQEAWEEAGLVGRLNPKPVGSFQYAKYGGTCHVIVFVLHVTEVSEDWPERSFRRRAWLTPERALRRINDPSLADVLRGVLLGDHAVLAKP